ncbi:hypothetical protein GCM10009414_29060 [Tatumella terrea]|uniref:hypothetical protein n=1 Tax=Tatumella terrea TaxID=419007 RepID=UPI0031DAB29C
MSSNILYPAITSAFVAVLALLFNKEMKENDYTKDWINSFSAATAEFISHLVQRNRCQQELTRIAGYLGTSQIKDSDQTRRDERWVDARKDLEKNLYNHLTELIKQEALIKMLLVSSGKIKENQRLLLTQKIEDSEAWRPGESLSENAEEICKMSSAIIKDEWIRIKKYGPVHKFVILVIISTIIIGCIELLKK